jgi:hypothetical protein
MSTILITNCTYKESQTGDLVNAQWSKLRRNVYLSKNIHFSNFLIKKVLMGDCGLRVKTTTKNMTFNALQS